MPVVTVAQKSMQFSWRIFLQHKVVPMKTGKKKVETGSTFAVTKLDDTQQGPTLANQTCTFLVVFPLCDMNGVFLLIKSLLVR